MTDASAHIAFKWNDAKKAPTEDGPSLLLTSGRDSLLGVFDGMGGAGARRVTTENGEITTEAAIAAQITHDSVTSFFRTGRRLRCPHGNLTITAERLQQHISSHLHEAEKQLNLPVSLLKGSLIRGMPTTVALAYCRLRSERTLQIDLLWAGDSRVYLFTPKHGLQQLSRDDLSIPGDAFENIYNDSPVSNVVNTTQPFFIHAHSVAVQLPAIVFCATDGCFGYLPTPQSFEFHLLESLYGSRTSDGWAADLENRVAQISQDDSSIALIAFGWPNFHILRKSFLKRRNLMRSDIKHEDTTDGQPEAAEHRSLLYERWASYKPQYEDLMYTAAGQG